MTSKELERLKVKHAELAKELGVSVVTVGRYRATSPKKLDLMIDGLKWRKLLRQVREAENAKKADKKDAI